MKLKKQHAIKIIFFFVASVSLVCIIWTIIPCNRATVLWKRGYQDKAILLWKNEISHKNDRASYQKIVEAYIGLAMYNEAEMFTQKALTYYPNCVNFYFYQAMVDFYKGRYNQSFVNTEKVISMNEYFPEVYLLRGMIMEKLNNPKQAKYEFIKEVNNNPGNRLAWAKLHGLQNED
ncbi:MAG TPA: hypothetical protein PKX05_03945 [bacterium]|nr:hypothetical protein [bacterium]